MKPRKCPRCELNYILNDDPYCKVCMEEVHGGIIDDESELCVVCNEQPVMSGKDMCASCYREMNINSGLSDEEFDSQDDLDGKKEEDLSELDVVDISDDFTDEVEYISLDELEDEEEDIEDEEEDE